MAIIDPIHSASVNKFSWLGMDLSSGLAEDTFITLTPNSPLLTVGRDAGGQSFNYSVDGDRSGTVEFTVNTQSSTNRYLNGIVKAQYANGGIPRFGNLIIFTGGTQYLYQPKQCVLMSRPTQSIGKDMAGNTQTWTFHSANLDPIDVANATLDDDLRASIQAQINVAVSFDF